MQIFHLSFSRGLELSETTRHHGKGRLGGGNRLEKDHRQDSGAVKYSCILGPIPSMGGGYLNRVYYQDPGDYCANNLPGLFRTPPRCCLVNPKPN